MLLAVAAAEIGARALAPRSEAIEPAAVDLRSYFSEEEIARGRRFSRPQLALALARASVEGGALAYAVRRGPTALRRLGRRPVVGGAVAGAALTTALSAPPLPLAALARRRAIKVGLVTQSWRGWGVDLVKQTGIGAALAGVGGAGAVSAMRRWPRSWWAPAGGGSVAFGAVLAAVAPVVLDPIFNKFEPLPEGETRADVLDLARRAGVNVGEVYSIDASRRTTAANAYVTGLGPTKRVVLFDTLLDRYSRDEIKLRGRARARPRATPRRGAWGGVRGTGRARRCVRRPAAELGPVARARDARGAPGRGARRRGGDRAAGVDLQPAVAGDRAARGHVCAGARRRAGGVRLIRASDRAPERRRHRTAPVGQTVLATHPSPASGSGRPSRTQTRPAKPAL